MKYVKATNSFGSGVLGRSLRHRFDIPQYAQGLERCDDFDVTGIGSLEKRNGTEYISDISGSYGGATDSPRILLPYKHEGSEYLIAMNSLFYYSTATEQYNCKWASIDTMTWLDVADDNPLQPDTSTAYVNYGSGKIGWAQLGLFLIVTHPSGQYEPIVFYIDNGAMRLKTWTEWVDVSNISYSGYNGDGITWMPSNVDTSLSITIDAAQTTATIPTGIYVYENQYIRVTDPIATKTGVYKVTDTSGYPSVTVTAIEALSSAVTSDDWGLSSTAYRRWYKSVGVYDQRLILGGTPLTPNTVYISATGSPRYLANIKLEQDTAPLVDSSSFAIDLVDGVEITFVYGTNVLIVGTDTQPYIIRGVNGVFSPTSIALDNTRALACGTVQPCNTPKGIAFTNNLSNRVYLGNYDVNTGSFDVVEVTALNRDITKKKNNTALISFDSFQELLTMYITKFVYNPDKNSLMCIMPTTVASLTMLDEAKTLGWYYSNFKDIGDEYAYVSSAVYSNSSGKLLYCFYRYDRHYIEELKEISTLGYLPKYYMDCHTGVYITSDGVSPQAVPTHLTGLDKLTYIKLSNGGYGTSNLVMEVGELLVTSDQVVYPESTGDLFIVGIGYQAEARTMPLEAGAQYGASRGDTQRITKAIISFVDSQDGVLSTDYDSESIPFDSGISWFTGDKSIDVPHSPDEEAYLSITSSLPLPCNIVGLTIHGVSYGT